MRLYKFFFGSILTLVAIVLTTNAFIGLIKDGGARAQGLHNAVPYVGILNVAPIIVVFCIISVALVFAKNEIYRLSAFYKLMIAWAGITCLWAPEQTIAVTSFFYILVIPATSLLLVRYFKGHEVYNCFEFSVIFIGVMSFVYAIFFPDYGIAADLEHDGLWQGVFTHKNSLGIYSVTTIAVLISLKPINSHSIYGFAAIVLHFYLLIKSGSSTSMLAALFAAPLYLLLNIFSFNDFKVIFLQRIAAVFIAASIIITLAITLVYLDPSYYPLVPDSILSRVYIWGYGWGLWSGSFIGGLGVNQYAYLNEKGFSDMEAILGYSVGSSHNASLEILVSYGFVGLIFYAAMMIGVAKLMVRNIGFCGAAVFLIVFLLWSLTTGFFVGG